MDTPSNFRSVSAAGSTTEPIHRWATFEDSWPPSLVERIFEKLAVGGTQTVVDPFAGAGTTAVCALRHVLKAVASDCSPLAVLCSKVKASPPAADAIDLLQRSIEIDFSEILSSFSAGRLASRDTSFVVAAALLRSSWYRGEAFDLDEVRSAASAILSEMGEDGTPPAAVPADVRTGSYHDLRMLLPIHQPVVVTSPPFPFSNQDPRRLKLERALCPDYVAPVVEPYPVLIEQLVNIAASIGCVSVAIEVPSDYAQYAERCIGRFFETSMMHSEDAPVVLGRRG